MGDRLNNSRYSKRADTCMPYINDSFEFKRSTSNLYLNDNWSPQKRVYNSVSEGQPNYFYSSSVLLVSLNNVFFCSASSFSVSHVYFFFLFPPPLFFPFVSKYDFDLKKNCACSLLTLGDWNTFIVLLSIGLYWYYQWYYISYYYHYNYNYFHYIYHINII